MEYPTWKMYEFCDDAHLQNTKQNIGGYVMIKIITCIIMLCSICSCSKKVTKVAIEQSQEQRQEVKEVPKIVNMVLPADKTDQIAVFDRVINFDFDRSDIRPDMLPIMRESARIMRENPAIVVRATGHTCDIGTVQYNHGLGLRRAVAVRDYLIANGVDGKRIEIESMGESEPVGTREQNRRCEINTLWK